LGRKAYDDEGGRCRRYDRRGGQQVWRLNVARGFDEQVVGCWNFVGAISLTRRFFVVATRMGGLCLRVGGKAGCGTLRIRGKSQGKDNR